MKNKFLILVTLIFVGILTLSSCKEECVEFYEKDCPTDNKYIPVCGCNGKTYANKTFADCAGVEYTNGKCAE